MISKAHPTASDKSSSEKDTSGTQLLSGNLQQVSIGKPLPFDICDVGGRLLLARGQVIHSEGQLEGLLDRGALVHRDLAAETVEKIQQARPHELPAHWGAGGSQLGRVLTGEVDAQFESTLLCAAKPVLALIECDPDLAILQVVRPDDGPESNYSSRHAMHAAIAGLLAARRLGWGADAGKSLFRAALTMNLSMSELQNRLATQVTPLTTLQRQTIREHPSRAAELLSVAGVTDPMWIEAVAHHHEQPDGRGYPKGLSDTQELALLLNRADSFTARFSPRVIRPAQPPDVAVRQFFAGNPKDPFINAIVKEFGLYPPGSTVQLANGEMGIVMRRGETATTPVVAVLTASNGAPLMTPIRRDTAIAGHAVVAVVPATKLKMQLPIELLVQVCSR